MSKDLAIVFFAPVVVALNPTLLAAVFVMILLPDPRRLMLGYLAGAYAVSMAAGLAIVLSLHGSGAVRTSGHLLTPGEYIAAGAAALVIAVMLATGHTPIRNWRARRKAAKASTGQPRPPWSRRMLGKGSAAVGFAVGAVMSFPGPVAVDALDHTAALNLPAWPVVLLVSYLCVMQQLVLELTLLADVFAPDQTRAAVARFKAWLTCHGRRIAVIGLTGAGLLLAVTGLAAIS